MERRPYYFRLRQLWDRRRRNQYSKDPAFQDAAKWFTGIDVALVGIGSLRASDLLASSGNIFSDKEVEQVQRKGAIGDICFQFIDQNGRPIESPLAERVIGIQLAELKRAKRVVGIAGGKEKTPAILAALRGQWINVLITDRGTAERLLAFGMHPLK